VCGGEELSRISSSVGVSVFVKVNRVIPFNSSNVFGVSSLEPNLDRLGICDVYVNSSIRKVET
jgi:hypothetical protein